MLKKHLHLPGVMLLAGLSVSAPAQVSSQNIVGYIHLNLYAGNNLVANPLASSDNTLNTIFQPGVPQGSTFTEWDPGTQQYLPPSVYDSVSGWSINYTWGYGQGGLFHTPTTFQNTLVGTVWPGFSLNSPFVPPLVPNRGAQLLDCLIPVAATFYDVMGREPQNGDSVTTLDGATQTTKTTEFDNGTWNNGVPQLAVGEAAYFDSGYHYNPAVVAAPEPAAWGLAGAGLLALALTRGDQRLHQGFGRVIFSNRRHKGFGSRLAGVRAQQPLHPCD